MAPVPFGFDAYAVLGVSRHASDDDIKQAYRRLALRSHPDKVRHEEQVAATRRFQEIQAAYEILSTDRRVYDAGPTGLALLKTPLMVACEVRDIRRVRQLLEDSADVTVQDSTGRTALMFAAGAASVELLRLLLERQACVEARNCAGHTCLMFGVGAGLKVDSPEAEGRAEEHLKAVRYLLDEGAHLDGATGYGLTALMLAATSGRLSMVELLLSRGADVNLASDIGLTALAMAADRGHAAIVQRLVARGASLDARFGAGKTTLMSAAAQAHLPVVRVLLGASAGVNLVSDDGHTALLYAVERGLKDGLICPIEGTEVDKPDAAAVVELLLEARATPNDSGPRGRSPLHAACAAGGASVVLVSLLLEAGARAGIADDEGRTPADVAFAVGRSDIVELLASARVGADVACEGGPRRRAQPVPDGCCAIWWAAATRFFHAWLVASSPGPDPQ